MTNKKTIDERFDAMFESDNIGCLYFRKRKNRAYSYNIKDFIHQILTEKGEKIMEELLKTMKEMKIDTRMCIGAHADGYNLALQETEKIIAKSIKTIMEIE